MTFVQIKFLSNTHCEQMTVFSEACSRHTIADRACTFVVSMTRYSERFETKTAATFGRIKVFAVFPSQHGKYQCFYCFIMFYRDNNCI